MNSAADFAKMLPGMDVLQGLVRNAGAALPGLNQWVTPTLDPAELDKRIQDLKTVHFWLEQNARLLATTIQALEVQRLTLTTLQTMNLPLADLAQALQARASAPAPSAAEPAPVPAPAPVPPPAPAPPADTSAVAGEAPPALVDPVQWWGALTQQFGEIASRALKDGAAAVPGAPAPRPAGTRGGSGPKTAGAAGKAGVKVGTKAGAKAGPKATAGTATRGAAAGGAKSGARKRPARTRGARRH